MTRPNDRPVSTLDVRVGNFTATVDLRAMPDANLDALCLELLEQLSADSITALRMLHVLEVLPGDVDRANNLRIAAASMNDRAVQLHAVALELKRRRREVHLVQINGLAPFEESGGAR